MSLIIKELFSQEFNISKEAVLKRPTIFSLSSGSIYDRLDKASKDSELSQWKFHPRYLAIINYFDKSNERIKVLRDADMKCVSLYSITSPEKRFSR